jgi:hypothetical protein
MNYISYDSGYIVLLYAAAVGAYITIYEGLTLIKIRSADPNPVARARFTTLHTIWLEHDV